MIISGTETPVKPTIESLLLVREIEEFFYHEADLLDDRKFEDWLDLLTEDMRYWMPFARNFRAGEEWREYSKELEEMAWFDENKTTLDLRVHQILTGIHWSEEPLSRTSHLITNVEILSVAPSVSNAEVVQTRSRFLVYRNRLQTETDIFVGKRKDTLRRIDDSWKIERREVYLDQNVLLAKNLTIFF